jgi:hypothetical protein
MDIIKQETRPTCVLRPGHQPSPRLDPPSSSCTPAAPLINRRRRLMPRCSSPSRFAHEESYDHLIVRVAGPDKRASYTPALVSDCFSTSEPWPSKNLSRAPRLASRRIRRTSPEQHTRSIRCHPTRYAPSAKLPTRASEHNVLPRSWQSRSACEDTLPRRRPLRLSDLSRVPSSLLPSGTSWPSSGSLLLLERSQSRSKGRSSGERK